MKFCPNCRNAIEDDALACPYCGYPYNTNSASQNTVNGVPRQRKTWLWVLGWIFIFPLPLTLILIRNSKMNKGLKIVILVAAWFIYLIFAIACASNNSNTEEQEAEPVEKQEVVLSDDTELPAEITEDSAIPVSETENSDQNMSENSSDHEAESTSKQKTEEISEDSVNTSPSEEVDSTEEAGPYEEFTEIVSDAIKWDIGPRDNIDSVELLGDELVIHVSLERNYTVVDRASGITDDILNLDDQYLNMWNSITIDFGSIGHITCTKDDIRDDGYGKYFDITDDMIIK